MEAASRELVIFGARSIALGACLAIRELYPECSVASFMVSKMNGNTETLCGLPVKEVADYTDKTIQILVATPEDQQHDIAQLLNKKGFYKIHFLDSQKEINLMKRYYEKIGRFPNLKEQIAEVYAVRFHGDKLLKSETVLPAWIKPIQAGAALTDMRIAELTDNTGDNISDKNADYCELTALYWIWKNKICSDAAVEYYGLFHYRRLLDISDEDLMRMQQEGVDVVLPYPTIHEPDMAEHHGRYINETDWQAMILALNQLCPDDAAMFKEILKQPYMYNYNMLVARKNVLRNYCEWLFPILERTEELCSLAGSKGADRYIGYLGENLLTLYFMADTKLKIRHCGRIMLK